MTCEDVLEQHSGLAKRREQSVTMLERARAEMVKCKTVRSPAIVVFCAGSIARLEAGKHSDLTSL
jgi:hypothetical protein